jgi:predicted Zn-dependent peptidase
LDEFFFEGSVWCSFSRSQTIFFTQLKNNLFLEGNNKKNTIYSVSMPHSQPQRKRSPFGSLSANRRYEVLKEFNELLEHLSGGDKRSLLEQFKISKQGKVPCENLSNSKKERKLDNLMSNISKSLREKKKTKAEKTTLISLFCGT